MRSAERIRRLVRLPPHQRWVLARAWWCLLVVDVALRIVSVTRLVPRAGAARPRHAPLSPARVAELLEIARRHSPVRPSCLTEALVLARLLHAEGVAATVRIGVARRDAALDAHAWVEHPGQEPGGPRDAGAYTALATPAERR